MIKIDRTPPNLTVPTNRTVYAASMSGASVTYTVTASDVMDAQPTVACLPASGSTFVIGTTAVSCIATGEGMIGLSWALFVAGVPSTVLSQWKVRSDSTSDLMVEFHTNRVNRNKKLSDAAAMRAAALKLRKDSRTSHPFYWAPFIVIGAGY
jgi:CHAT domain/HYR domain